MKKIVITLIILFSLVSCASAYTNNFTNGGFETGSFTGWTPFGQVDYPTVETYANYTGDYGADLYSYYPTSIVWAEIKQTVDTTNANYLSFYYKIVQQTSTTDECYIQVNDGTNIFLEYDPPVGDWIYVKLTDFNKGAGTIMIFRTRSGPGNKIEVYFDNICSSEINDDCGWTPPGDDPTISWYPNNETTNTSFIYDIEIENLEPLTVYYYAYYKSTWLEDSEEWTPYTHQLFGFVDDYELCPGTGRCTIAFFQENTDGIYNHIGTNYWSNDYYKIVKWQIRLMHLNMSVISTDTIIYDANDSWIPPNETIPDIPEPEPTPTPTYTPLPWPTPTEIPTPVPTPGIENYTINTSQMGDYYSSVNDSMGTLNDSISGSTNFLLIPVIGFTSYINTINTSLIESINQSTGHKSILQQMLLPIFDNVPTKVMAIVTYYLVLLIILIILRG